MKSVSISSLDEQIRQLENALNESSSEDSSSGSGSGSESDSSEEDGLESEDGLLVEKDSTGSVVRLISSIQQSDRIAPLPNHQLPSKQCRFSGHSVDPDTKKRRVSFHDAPQPRPQKPDGFQKTVSELLAQYEPASNEKRPFYCRVCKFQGTTTEELESHRLSQSHIDTAQLEKRVCFCKLCRKQFTSPEQLKEHLKGKAHKDRLEKLRKAHHDKRAYC